MVNQRASTISKATGATAVSYDQLIYTVERDTLDEKIVTPQLIGSRTSFTLNLAEMSIADGGTVVLKRWVADANTTLRVNRGGITDSAGNEQSGLEIRAVNATDVVTTTLITSDQEWGDPLHLFDVGGDDVRIEVYNGTSGSLSVIADITCEIYIPR